MSDAYYGYRLAPWETALLGKRVEEKVRERRLVLIDWAELEGLRKRAQTSHDKEAAFRQQRILCDQIEGMGRKIAALEESEREHAEAYLTGRCKDCRSHYAAVRHGGAK